MATPFRVGTDGISGPVKRTFKWVGFSNVTFTLSQVNCIYIRLDPRSSPKELLRPVLCRIVYVIIVREGQGNSSPRYRRKEYRRGTGTCTYTQYTNIHSPQNSMLNKILQLTKYIQTLVRLLVLLPQKLCLCACVSVPCVSACAS